MKSMKLLAVTVAAFACLVESAVTYNETKCTCVSEARACLAEGGADCSDCDLSANSTNTTASNTTVTWNEQTECWEPQWEAALEVIFDKFDTNQNGMKEPDEIEAWGVALGDALHPKAKWTSTQRQGFESTWAQRYANADANNDTHLTLEELTNGTIAQMELEIAAGSIASFEAALQSIKDLDPAAHPQPLYDGKKCSCAAEARACADQEVPATNVTWVDQPSDPLTDGVLDPPLEVTVNNQTRQAIEVKNTDTTPTVVLDGNCTDCGLGADWDEQVECWEPQWEAALKVIFDKFDADKNGKKEPNEIDEWGVALGDALHPLGNWTDEQRQGFETTWAERYANADADGDEHLTFEELKTGTIAQLELELEDQEVPAANVTWVDQQPSDPLIDEVLSPSLQVTVDGKPRQAIEVKNTATTPTVVLGRTLSSFEAALQSIKNLDPAAFPSVQKDADPSSTTVTPNGSKKDQEAGGAGAKEPEAESAAAAAGLMAAMTLAMTFV